MPPNTIAAPASASDSGYSSVPLPVLQSKAWFPTRSSPYWPNPASPPPAQAPAFSPVDFRMFGATRPPIFDANAPPTRAPVLAAFGTVANGRPSIAVSNSPRPTISPRPVLYLSSGSQPTALIAGATAFVTLLVMMSGLSNSSMVSGLLSCVRASCVFTKSS